MTSFAGFVGLGDEPDYQSSCLVKKRKNRGSPLRNRQVLGVVSDPEMKGDKFCRVCRARGRARLPEFLFGKKGGLKVKRVILLSLSILLISLAYSFADVPCKINYQGRLIKDNVPVDGTKTMRFSIYPDAVGGSPIWTSGNVSVEVHNGLFRYVLDLSTIDWAAGQTLYLEVKVGTDILTPREELYAYPYAINSHLLEGKTKEYFINTSVDAQTKQGNLNIMGNVGIGTTSPSHLLDLKSGNQNFLQFDRTGTGSNVNNTFDFRVSAAGSTDTDFIELYPSGLAGSGLTLMGNGNIGIGTTSPQAQLDVDGSFRIGGGTVIKKVQAGYIGTGEPGSAGSVGTVTFPTPFSTVPLIFLTAQDQNDSGANIARVITRSITNFTWSSWAGGSRSAADRIFWIAVEVE
ncbi:hypothetical protein ES705_03559 [subsurface metagenome]